MRCRRTGEADRPADGPLYVEVKLFMVVNVDELTLTVTVQASGSWRFTYVAVTVLIVVLAAIPTVVVVLHTSSDNWRLDKP